MILSYVVPMSLCNFGCLTFFESNIVVYRLTVELCVISIDNGDGRRVEHNTVKPAILNIF